MELYEVKKRYQTMNTKNVKYILEIWDEGTKNINAKCHRYSDFSRIPEELSSITSMTI